MQHVVPANMEAYLAVEDEFAVWERRRGRVHQRRLWAIAGAEPVDTFVREGVYPTRAAAMAAIEEMEEDPEHSELWSRQVKYIVDRRVELLDMLDFEAGEPQS